MSEVLQANIFFVITSISVVVITVLLAIALWKVIRILGVVRDITDRIRQGTEELSEDIDAVRSFLSSSFLGSVIRMVTGAETKKPAKKKATKKKSGTLKVKDEND